MCSNIPAACFTITSTTYLPGLNSAVPPNCTACSRRHALLPRSTWRALRGAHRPTVRAHHSLGARNPPPLLPLGNMRAASSTWRAHYRAVLLSA